MSTRHGLLASIVLTGLGLACADCSRGADAPARAVAPAAAPATDSTVPSPPDMPPPDVPSPGQSAGLFVGVGEFMHERASAYTTNDAVDLAHALSVEHGLLHQNHVRILLSGNLTGAAERRYREMLGDAFIAPTKGNFLRALEEEASLVGPQGILYVFVASHGFAYGQDNYVMTSDSDPRDPHTAVSSQEILNATHGARGRIVLILDSCRLWVPAAADAKPKPAGPAAISGPRASTGAWAIFRQLTSHPGYAVLFATRPYQIAVVDPSRPNGLFTGALLDGLSCKEASTQTRPVSLFSLAAFAQNETKKRSPESQSPELLTADGFRDFLLLRCGPIGEILEPHEGVIVTNPGVVRLRVFQPGSFYARAVIHSLANGVYFPQHPETSIPASPGGTVILPVDYGLATSYLVYVGLGAGSDSLPTDTQITALPETDSKGRPIYWLGPVRVTARN